MAHYYLVAISAHNYGVLQEEGFKRYGFKHFRAVKNRPAAGDKVLFYIKGGPKCVSGIATVTGDVYEPDPKDLLWSAEDGPILPHRFPLEPDLVLDAASGALIEPLISELELFRHGAIKSWGLVLHTQNQEISAEDYKVLRKAIQAAAKKSKG